MPSIPIFGALLTVALDDSIVQVGPCAGGVAEKTCRKRRNVLRRLLSNPEPFRCVYRVLAGSDLKQQARLLVITADGSDALPRFELFADLHGDALQMRAHRIEMVAVLHDHRVAEARVVVGERD